jgi:hypothetical protein
MSLEINAPWWMSIPSPGTAIALILPRLSRSDAGAAQDEAIRILANAASDLDDREWAERHLCRMAGADKSAFMRNRKRQS